MVIILFYTTASTCYCSKCVYFIMLCMYEKSLDISLLCYEWRENMFDQKNPFHFFVRELNRKKNSRDNVGGDCASYMFNWDLRIISINISLMLQNIHRLVHQRKKIRLYNLVGTQRSIYLFIQNVWHLSGWKHFYGWWNVQKRVQFFQDNNFIKTEILNDISTTIYEET